MGGTSCDVIILSEIILGAEGEEGGRGGSEGGHGQ